MPRPLPRSRAHVVRMAPARLALAMLTSLMVLLGWATMLHAQDLQPIPIEADADGIIRTHGYSYYGTLHYPADFQHFSYVNPDAPKGGEFSTWASGTFDSMNPYAQRGSAGAYAQMVYESLLGEEPAGGAAPADVYGEYYGLLAESLEYPEGREWVIFHMRPEARFSDGTPVTAHDVVFSHNLFLDQGLASYAAAVRQVILSAEALDDHTVKFTFADGIPRRSLIEQVGFVTVFPQKWFEETGARLDEPRLDAPPGSGPYMLDSYDINRRIVYRRNPDYWGADLPINRGRHNFDRIRIEYFADDTAAFEAFKIGDYTFRAETNSRQWATGYGFPAARQGHVVREVLPNGTPPNASGLIFNLGREIFADKRVREAISLAYNFEWSNATYQHGLFKQRNSFSQGSPLEAQGVPEGEELAFLQALGDLVPPELLSEPAVMAHQSSVGGLADRGNLRRAGRLLDEAGWEVGSDGIRRNSAGQPLRIEFPLNSSSSPVAEAIVSSFGQNLRSLGVDLRMVKMDPAQYTLRTRDRNYDMVLAAYRSFLDAGTGLWQSFGSREADVASSFNPAHLASPLVDRVIELALETTTTEERDVAMRVLDRVLRFERIMVPLWYTDESWVAYWDIYERPETLPPYSDGEMDFWWVNPDKVQALRAAGALR
ncbi:extracellular solute-binding protein [Plastorhodobacter daqingensis]|uniref:Extracellular solute-binding protein n=1 Tax=Plastorhodobacter daqingensis TaxID=1387281 RepID=A0ABW2UM20_9RHOB